MDFEIERKRTIGSIYKWIPKVIIAFIPTFLKSPMAFIKPGPLQ